MTSPVTADIPTSIPNSRYISSRIINDRTTYNVISIVAPLTKPFTQPSSCQNVIVHFPVPRSFTYGGRCPTNSLQGDMDTACHPPWDTPAALTATAAMTQFRTARTDVKPVINTIPMYSPATGCPAGFAVACTIATESHGPLSSLEEALVCCPQCVVTKSVENMYLPANSETFRGFSCYDVSSCFRRIPTATVIATLCDTEPSVGTFTVTSDSQPPYAGLSMYASQIAIVRSPKAREAPAINSSGLSSSLQAAIGVSVSLGVILLALIGYLLYRYRKRKSTQQPDDASTADVEPNTTVHELQAKSKLTDMEVDAKDTERIIYELPETCITEAPEDAFAPAELDIEVDESARLDSNAQKPDASGNCRQQKG